MSKNTYKKRLPKDVQEEIDTILAYGIHEEQHTDYMINEIYAVLVQNAQRIGNIGDLSNVYDWATEIVKDGLDAERDN